MSAASRSQEAGVAEHETGRELCRRLDPPAAHARLAYRPAARTPRALTGTRFCLIGTEGRSGSSAATRARFAMDDERLLVRAPTTGDLASRVWGGSRVTVAPCSRWGRALGPPIKVAARVIAADEEGTAEAALEAGGGRLERLPLRLQRRRGVEQLYVELVPTGR